MKLHGLTEEQKVMWDANGYVVLEQFLSDNEVADYNTRMDQAFAQVKASGIQNADTAQMKNVEQVAGIINYDDAFLELMEHPRMMGIMRDVLGDSFVMVDNDALIKPPKKAAHTQWHRDTETKLFIKEQEIPFMVKVFYFLSDVHFDGGCLAFLPGSHKLANSELPKADTQEDLPGHVRMNVKAGTAVVFHGYLYHSALNNFTDYTRRSLIYNYGQSFLKIWPGYEPSERVVAEAQTNLRKMLLGITPWVSDPKAFG